MTFNEYLLHKLAENELHNNNKTMPVKDFFTPKRIVHNRKNGTTIVFWIDGSKTIVKPMDKDQDNPYNAFTAALAKRIFGSNSQVNKIVGMTYSPEKRKKKRNKQNRKPITEDEARKMLKALIKEAGEKKDGTS